jgi:hypothetical protein
MKTTFCSHCILFDPPKMLYDAVAHENLCHGFSNACHENQQNPEAVSDQ